MENITMTKKQERTKHDIIHPLARKITIDLLLQEFDNIRSTKTIFSSQSNSHSHAHDHKDGKCNDDHDHGYELRPIGKISIPTSKYMTNANSSFALKGLQFINSCLKFVYNIYFSIAKLFGYHNLPNLDKILDKVLNESSKSMIGMPRNVELDPTMSKTEKCFHGIFKFSFNMLFILNERYSNLINNVEQDLAEIYQRNLDIKTDKFMQGGFIMEVKEKFYSQKGSEYVPLLNKSQEKSWALSITNFTQGVSNIPCFGTC